MAVVVYVWMYFTTRRLRQQQRTGRWWVINLAAKPSHTRSLCERERRKRRGEETDCLHGRLDWPAAKCRRSRDIKTKQKVRSFLSLSVLLWFFSGKEENPSRWRVIYTMAICSLFYGSHSSPRFADNNSIMVTLLSSLSPAYPTYHVLFQPDTVSGEIWSAI